MVHSLRKRLGAALVCVGLVTLMFGVYSPRAGAANSADPNAAECPNGGLKIDNINGSFNGTYSNDGLTVTITNSTQFEFTWASVVSETDDDPGLAVAYIIAKGSTDRDRIPETGEFTGDAAFGGTVNTDLETKTGSQAAISHITFCLPGDAPGVPFVSIDKDAESASVSPGGVMTFVVGITVGGDDEAEATGVVIEDQLDPDFEWSISGGDPDELCAIDGDMLLTCDLDDLVEGDTYSVEVSADTEGHACESVPNTATVKWGEQTENETNEASASVSIGGSCGFTPLDVTGPLTINKVVTGVPFEDVIAYQFTFNVDCTNNAFDQTVTITGDGSETITGIPEGTSCTVTETDIAPDLEGFSWSTTVSDSDGGVAGTVAIVDAAGESVTVTNARTEVQGVVVTTTTTTTTTAPPPPTVKGITLARTGSHTGSMLALAGVAMVLGGLLVGSGEAAQRRARAVRARP
jgi:hypothetical protein